MNAFYNEIDPFAAEWMRHLVAHKAIVPGVIDERSVEEITPTDVATFTGQQHYFAGIGGWSHALRRAGVPDHIPIWTGSCPCQGLSDAGKRLGALDPRHLWPAWSSLISECRPPVILGEQVASRLGLEWLDLVFADLERCGYTVGAADLCAAGVGAPHARQRLYFVAYAGERGREVVREARLHDRGQPGLDASGCGSYSGMGDPGSDRAQQLAGVVRGDEGEHGGWSAHGSHTSVPPSGSRDVVDSAGGTSGLGVHEGTGDRSLTSSGGHGNVGDPSGAGRREGAARGSRGRDGLVDERESGVLVDAHGLRWQRREGGGWEARRGPEHAGLTRGFWAGAEWLLCNDPGGPVYRPVAPGTFPLAHGFPNRVGTLRGYGNAICIETAVAFIRASFAAILGE